MAPVSGAVNLPELGVGNKSLAGYLGQIAVAAGQLNATDAQFALFTMA